ncbi:family transcriptional regulator, partial [Lasius niger]
MHFNRPGLPCAECKSLIKMIHQIGKANIAKPPNPRGKKIRAFGKVAELILINNAPIHGGCPFMNAGASNGRDGHGAKTCLKKSSTHPIKLMGLEDGEKSLYKGGIFYGEVVERFKAPVLKTGFFNETPEFLIAQYISVIDKIFNKPKKLPENPSKNPNFKNLKPEEQNQKQNKFQKDLTNWENSKSNDLLTYRQALGKVVWKHLQKEHKISNEFKPLWDRKIKATQKRLPTQIEGRLYKKISPCLPARLNNSFYNVMTSKIDAHIFKNALRLHAETPKKGLGLVPRQALAIKNNVLKEKTAPSKDYKKEDFKDYEDVISEIYAKIKERLEKEEEINSLRKKLKDRNTRNHQELKQKITKKSVGLEKPYHIAIGILKEQYLKKKYTQEDWRTERKNNSPEFNFYTD